MKVDVTELGPVKRALKIEVPSEDVNKHFALAYAELNKHVRIPGFRPGKAPLSMLEKRYAKEVEEDVVRRLVPDYYERAVREAGIVPVLVEIPPLERVKIKKDAAFSFTATVEIKPKIELRDYKAPNPISLKPDKRTVTDEQVAGTLDVLRERQAQLEAAPAGTALAEGDYAILDVEGFLEQTPVDGAKQTGQLHKIGSKTPILGIEVDAALVGKKEGELAEIPQPYPASHPDQRLAGKTVVYRVTVAAVKRKKLPALDDEFAKDCGPYASMAELTEKLRGEMEKALKKDVEDTYKDTILKRLEETHHFDLPDTLVERELEAIVRQQMQARQRQKGQPQSPDPVVRQEEIRKAREEHKAEAMRRVKIGLVLEAIAEKEGLKVEQEDIQNELLRLSQELRMAPEELGRLIQSGGQDSIDELRARILADKALDFVFRHSVIQG
ncbi:MAG: trigger factor [Nitrospirota bacterium]|nr:trigger factor [Nitrospirota bacterium]MDE3225116.1 trigger factor [Nitrospirota bacterium]MDE3242606.1 trigger factor [Nitrospirota bacterium]